MEIPSLFEIFDMKKNNKVKNLFSLSQCVSKKIEELVTYLQKINFCKYLNGENYVHF